jgi:hypothetical protein
MTEDEIITWHAKSIREHEIRFATMMIEDLKNLGYVARIGMLVGMLF